MHVTARYRIDVRRQRACLLDINGFPTCLTSRSYRYRNCYSWCECARATAGVSQAVIVIRYRRALSAKFEPGTGVRRRQGVPASTTGKLMRYHGLSPKSGEAVEFIFAHSQKFAIFRNTILFVIRFFFYAGKYYYYYLFQMFMYVTNRNQWDTVLIRTFYFNKNAKINILRRNIKYFLTFIFQSLVSSSKYQLKVHDVLYDTRILSSRDFSD